MKNSQHLKEKLRAVFYKDSLTAQGMRRLLVIVLSVMVAKTVFRLGATVLMGLAVAVCVLNQYNSSDSPIVNQKTAEAHRMVEEVGQIIDVTNAKAEAIRKKGRIAAQEEEIKRAMQQTTTALVAYNTELLGQGNNSVFFTDNYDNLYKYGWQPNANLIYKPIELVPPDDKGQASAIVTIAHREKGPRAFQYDFYSGQGIEPVEPDGGLEKP